MSVALGNLLSHLQRDLILGDLIRLHGVEYQLHADDPDIFLFILDPFLSSKLQHPTTCMMFSVQWFLGFLNLTFPKLNHISPISNPSLSPTAIGFAFHFHGVFIQYMFTSCRHYYKYYSSPWGKKKKKKRQSPCFHGSLYSSSKARK